MDDEEMFKQLSLWTHVPKPPTEVELEAFLSKLTSTQVAMLVAYLLGYIHGIKGIRPT